MPKKDEKENNPIKDLLESEAGIELKNMILREIGYLDNNDSIVETTIVERGLSLEANMRAKRIMKRIWSNILGLEQPKGRADKNQFGVGI